MKLTDLTNTLRSNIDLKEFYIKEKLDLESEAILVYMQDRLSLDSELFFLSIENTEDELYFEYDGVSLIQLFPLEYLIDLISTDFSDKRLSDGEISEKILNFRIKDA